MNARGHHDEHINFLSDDRIVQWSFDDGCGCDPDDECDCFIYGFISKDEAKGILEKNYNGAIPQEVQELLDRR